jgi:hypothetical protein
VTRQISDVAATARANAARNLTTAGVEMVLALEDMRMGAPPPGPAERADGEALALCARGAADALYPSDDARDLDALARVLEIVATHDLELPR